MTHQTDERGDPLTRTHDPERKVFAARETRQGLLGQPILKVLLISLFLAFLVWGALELWGNRIAPDEPDGAAQSTTTNSNSSSSSTTSGISPTTSETTVPEGAIDDTPPDGGTPTATDRDPTPQSSTGGETQRVTPDGTAQ